MTPEKIRELRRELRHENLDEKRIWYRLRDELGRLGRSLDHMPRWQDRVERLERELKSKGPDRVYMVEAEYRDLLKDVKRQFGTTDPGKLARIGKELAEKQAEKRIELAERELKSEVEGDWRPLERITGVSIDAGAIGLRDGPYTGQIRVDVEKGPEGFLVPVEGTYTWRVDRGSRTLAHGTDRDVDRIKRRIETIVENDKRKHPEVEEIQPGRADDLSEAEIDRIGYRAAENAKQAAYKWYDRLRADGWQRKSNRMDSGEIESRWLKKNGPLALQLYFRLNWGWKDRGEGVVQGAFEASVHAARGRTVFHRDEEKIGWHTSPDFSKDVDTVMSKLFDGLEKAVEAQNEAAPSRSTPTPSGDAPTERQDQMELAERLTRALPLVQAEGDMRTVGILKGCIAGLRAGKVLSEKQMHHVNRVLSKHKLATHLPLAVRVAMRYLD